ncbi:MAG: ATP-binding protein [Vicinamibacterales bacterium]|jgi:two-component system OmpR family sensor kinase
MTLSFRSRLTLRWVLAFGLVLSVANLAVYFGARSFLRRDLDAQLRTLASTELASAVDEPGLGLHLHEFPVGAHSPQEYADKFVQLIDAGGRVLMQSPRLGKAEALIDKPVLIRALSGGAPLVDVNVGERRGRMIGLASPGPERYVVAVGVFTGQLDATLRQLRNLLIGIWFGALGLTAIIGFSLASRALVPIRRITHQAAAIAAGKFAKRLDPPQQDDEIGQMTRLLNQMLERLHGALEANRRFAADASHELRGPLTAMLGEIDVTLKRDRGPEEYRDALDRLRERLHVMSRLTEDLMLLVRAQENQQLVVGEVRVAELLHRVMARTADAAAAARVVVAVDAAPDLVVYGDAGLLERVFDNLVCNGIQYNHEGGTVTVTARFNPGAGEWVADQVLTVVRDSGAGIPEAERERVFERFYRIDSSRSRRTGGAGLGLAISREIVQLFKGTIRVADSAGSGTAIEVGLPGGLATR